MKEKMKKHKNTTVELDFKTLYKKVNSYLKSFDLTQVNLVTDTTRPKKRGFKSDAKLREICPNEIVIEFDTNSRTRGLALARRVIKRLRANRYNFLVFDHFGRSPHIHIYDIKGLETLDDDMRRLYKRNFLIKYANFDESDFSLTGNTHLIAMEWKEHFKHKNVKQLVMFTTTQDYSLSNTLEPDLMEITKDEMDVINRIEKNPVIEEDNTWFVNWALNEQFPQGERNNKILKNVAIVTYNQKLDKDAISMKLSQMYGNWASSCYKGWLKWCDHQPRTFGVRELIEYCDRHGYDFSQKRSSYNISF